MITIKEGAQLYDRCSSIEVKDFGGDNIKVFSLDSYLMSTAFFTKPDELKMATISTVLRVYLNDEVIITDELCTLFENEMQLASSNFSYNSTLIMYSDIIVKALIDNGYEKGLKSNALVFAK